MRGAHPPPVSRGSRRGAQPGGTWAVVSLLLELAPWALMCIAGSLLCAGGVLLRFFPLAGVTCLVLGGALCVFTLTVLLLTAGHGGAAVMAVLLALLCVAVTVLP